MTSQLIPGLEQNVDRLVKELRHATPGREALLRVVGPPTSGRTVLLAALAERLQAERLQPTDLVPVLVAPPQRALDAAGLALLSIAGAARSNGWSDGWDEKFFAADASWSRQYGAIRDVIERHAPQLVLLVDEPEAWMQVRAEDSPFRNRIEQVVDLVAATAPCRRVVTASTPGPARSTLRLAPCSEPIAFLRDARWGVLGEVAGQLADTVGSRLSSFSPLHVRIVVGLAALESEPVVRRWLEERTSRRALSERLAARMADTELRPLGSIWARLALERLPFGDDLLARLGVGSLSERARALLEHCLLYEIAGKWRLHETLRADATERGWLTDRKRYAAHRDLADYHRERFESLGQEANAREALLHEAEVFHHFSEAGEWERALELSPRFADQLSLLGRKLSRDFRRYEEAGKVFERAVKRDPESDYAHHYLAWNLDVQGIRRDDVDRHYRKAIELDPRHEWWRSRFVCFLITIGRTAEAREAWDDALDALGLPSADADPALYEHLHLWTARLLIHRGQLDFGGDVLDRVPPSVTREHMGLRALERRLRVLLDVREKGAVFPTTIRPDLWWEGGPHRLPQKEDLRRWLAARVDAVEAGTLHLHVAERIDDGTVRHARLEVPFEKFNRWTRDARAEDLTPGRFVEIGYYGRAGKTIIAGVHRDTEWEDPDLPPLFPDPQRYLRRWGQAS